MDDQKKNKRYITLNKMKCVYMNNSFPFQQLPQMNITSKKDNESQIAMESLKIGSEQIYMALLSEDNKDKNDISHFDLAVMDSVYTLFFHKQYDITPAMVFRVFSGNFSQEVSKKNQDIVEKSIERLSKIECYIDYSRLAANRKMKNRNTRLGCSLLPVSEKKIRLKNGQVVDGYHLERCPPIYQFAEDLKQIISLPIDNLRIKPTINTPQVIMLKRYLYKRIALLANRKNNIVKYKIRMHYNHNEKEGILGSIDVEKNNYKNWAKKKSQIKKYTNIILDEFVAIGLIDQYEPYQIDGTFAGYVFSLVKRGKENE